MNHYENGEVTVTAERGGDTDHECDTCRKLLCADTTRTVIPRTEMATQTRSGSGAMNSKREISSVVSEVAATSSMRVQHASLFAVQGKAKPPDTTIGQRQPKGEANATTKKHMDMIDNIIACPAATWTDPRVKRPLVTT